jgi:SAM-dependent MidA family methyltransferase
MPAGDAGRHGAAVRSAIDAAIAAAGGWLSFERYMELALYAPGLGYYSAGARKFGAAGDFVTAPEISPLFGACVARQCAEVLEACVAGSILEIGAGTGRLAVDVLARLESLGRLPEHYWILETSADLRERQFDTLARSLPHLIERIHWLDAPPAAGFDGLILANEVLDALPVRRFTWNATGTQELGVINAGDQLAWEPRPADASLELACAQLRAAGGGWEAGYISEYCERLSAWTHYVTRPLRRGAVLWFDYGLPRSQYYFAERHGGTLLCHHRQQANDDPLQRPGLQDITAWVDFTRLAEAAAGADFGVAGFTTQTWFLAGTGIDLEMQRLAAGDANRAARLANQARQLVMPGEMGERFKAMAWIRGLDLPLAGFELRDFRASL